MSIDIPNILMILTIHHDHLNHESEPEEHVLYPLTESLELRDHLHKKTYLSLIIKIFIITFAKTYLSLLNNFLKRIIMFKEKPTILFFIVWVTRMMFGSAKLQKIAKIINCPPRQFADQQKVIIINGELI